MCIMEIDETLNKLLNNTIDIKNRLIELEDKLKEKDILIEDLNAEIAQLKGLSNEENKFNYGLLGNLKDIKWNVENYATYSIENDGLVIQGTNRYASIKNIYNELPENYRENVRTKYLLHIEGYKEKGCSNSYICTNNNLIVDNKFNMNIELLASWERQLNIVIMLNQSNGEDSKIVITSLKLTLL